MPDAPTYTYADLASFPDDGLRREIYHGQLLASPAPRIRHQIVLARLFVAIYNHVAATDAGLVLPAPTDIVLADDSVFEPDILFLPASQQNQVTDLNIQGPPALAVEVVSNSTRDRVIKRDAYAEFGVAEYWIVDPDADRVEVLLLHGDRYDPPSVLEPGDTLTTSLLPGLSIDVAMLLTR